MTPRVVHAGEVRFGDQVRWSFRGTTVEGMVTAVVGEVETWTIEVGHLSLGVSASDVKITLLDRPLSPIPTDEGTVVRSKATGNVFVLKAHRWLGAFGELGNPNVTRDLFDVLVPEQVER